MDSRSELLNEIEKIIERLADPITSQEVSDGWTRESKQALKNFFEDLYKKLLTNQPIPPLSIPRGMDFWGIIGGDLLDKAAQVSNKLREF